MGRAIIFWSASLLLALWILAGLAALLDLLLTGDGGSDLLYGSLVWLAGALPLVAILLALGRPPP